MGFLRWAVKSREVADAKYFLTLKESKGVLRIEVGDGVVSRGEKRRTCGSFSGTSKSN